jgi:threonine/homoserine efflux transporter RhtA
VNDSPEAVSAVTRPWTLLLALILLAAQVVGLVALAIWLLVLSVTTAQTSTGAGIAEAVLALGIAALLGGATVSMRRGHSGMRGVTIFVELLLLPLGYYLARAGLWEFAVIAWALGAGMVVLLIAPSTREALGVE